MESYKEFLKSEVQEFRKAGHRFLEKEISKAEFKGISGGMGVYAQQDQKSFMIRLRTPSGLISKEHLNLILSYVHKYGLEKVHLTTRQAVQLHDLDIDSVCDIMEDGIDHDLFTRGGGGNFPRNVSLSPLAGVEKAEAFDVTPYALQVGNYFLGNAPSYKLPRKLKVAFSSDEKDTAAASINDMGFMAVSEKGIPMFRMWLAGGMGQGPAVAVPYPSLVRPQEVLYYVEAMIQLFIAEGDYENKAKARTRFIPRRMGTEAFLECFEKHLEEVKKTHQFEEIAPVAAEGMSSCEDLNGTCIAQRQEGLYTVILHPVCGQLAAQDLEKSRNSILPNGNFAEPEALQGNPCGSERSRTLRKPAANDSDQWMSEQLCKASGGRDWICGKKSKSRRSVGRCVPAFRGRFCFRSRYTYGRTSGSNACK